MASAIDQTGLPVGSVLACLHHGIVLGVFRVTSPTPPQVSLRGPRKDFLAVNDRCTTMCWHVLGGPWKACSRPHKTGQSPTRRFLLTPQLVVQVIKCVPTNSEHVSSGSESSPAIDSSNFMNQKTFLLYMSVASGIKF